jgi:molybdenum transport protein
VPHGDLTTEALGIGMTAAIMDFSARDPMVLALVEDAAAMIELCGCRADLLLPSGRAVESGTPILKAQGSAAGLMRSWKVAQTLIEVWSGVATAASEIVKAATTGSPGVALACTRKNTPGTKRFAAAAIKAGGAVMHRLGLSETVLVFPEHRTFLGDDPLAATAERLKRSCPEKKLVIEVITIEAAVAAAEAGFDVVQLEKFNPSDVAMLVERLTDVPRRPAVAVAGGVNSTNAASYARAGADVLVTSWPYRAKPRDVQVRIRS